jgi:predicted RNA-binding protein YlqC (UPF0109 family)
MADAERLQQWVQETVRMMVDHPNDVRVEAYESGGRVALRLHLHSSDVGKVIGKEGRHARALRTIGSVIAAAMGAHFTLDIPREQ